MFSGIKMPPPPAPLPGPGPRLLQDQFPHYQSALVVSVLWLTATTGFLVPKVAAI